MQLTAGSLSDAAIADHRVDQPQHLGRRGLTQLPQAFDGRRQPARLSVAEQAFALGGMGTEQSGDEIGRLGHGEWRVARCVRAFARSRVLTLWRSRVVAFARSGRLALGSHCHPERGSATPKDPRLVIGAQVTDPSTRLRSLRMTFRATRAANKRDNAANAPTRQRANAP